ncbi:uncharacterized protein EKO05_0009647 [Ascochyta rabiei]|uniref:uncharacterized protein n=1 Tax=Didymella rabiei TaxID=5454 RepID=UPI002202172E|nr:uncharacterized protein EKO05_0009647 [Ascochyta rabiei]UPX19383.1 hypothetical protein EKO05_0009647 [Ascochyta rabiei]
MWVLLLTAGSSTRRLSDHHKRHLRLPLPVRRRHPRQLRDAGHALLLEPLRGRSRNRLGKLQQRGRARARRGALGGGGGVWSVVVASTLGLVLAL